MIGEGAMTDRYKKEIEEILDQAGELGSARGAPYRQGFLKLLWMQLVQSVSGQPWSISPGRVMIGAVGLLLVALLLRPAVPAVVEPILWASLIVFIVGYAMFFIRKPTIEKHWRGQPIEYSTSWWDRLRSRIK